MPSGYDAWFARAVKNAQIAINAGGAGSRYEGRYALKRGT
jgi:hypothetical protein